jgi:hypothetical protein
MNVYARAPELVPKSERARTTSCVLLHVQTEQQR